VNWFIVELCEDSPSGVGEFSPRGNRGFLEQEVLKSLKPSNRDRALMSSEVSRPVLDSFLLGGDLHMYFLTDGEVSARHRIWERRVHRPLEGYDFVLLSETDIRLQQGRRSDRN
jgi:hypothetical protein